MIVIQTNDFDALIFQIRSTLGWASGMQKKKCHSSDCFKFYLNENHIEPFRLVFFA